MTGLEAGRAADPPPSVMSSSTALTNLHQNFLLQHLVHFRKITVAQTAIAIMPDSKNIWVAAADGDLARVQELVEQQSVSPNAPDPFTYTPMHAAASYAQFDVLAYLVQQGGDVNITDEDGDTPLYTVENIDTAQWLIDHGALIDWRNATGLSPIEHLDDEFPEVAAFLRSSTTTSAQPQPSQHSQDAASETLTSNLIQSVSDIMHRAESEGTDPDEALREAVSRTVLEGVLTGFELSTQPGADDPNPDEQHSKRPRLNGFQ